MKRTALNRRVPMQPAQILDVIAEEQTWREDGGSITIHSGRTDGLRLTTSMPIDRAQIPAAAQSFLGSGKIVQHIRSAPVSDTARAAELHIVAEVPGAPLDVQVDISLLCGTDGITDLQALIEINSSLPLVGAMIESSAEPHIVTMIAKSLDRFPAR